MAVFDKIKNKISFEIKLYRETNAKISVLQFVRDFLIRDGMKLYNRIEFAKQEEIKRFLKSDLSDVIEKYKEKDIVNHKKIRPVNVWTFWGQGFENAPDIVKKCNEQLRYQAEKSKVIKIVELDLNNYKNYVKIPENIVRLYHNGSLSVVNFSDILRVFLLSQCGGGWVDATVYVSSPLDEIYNSPIYTVKHDLFKEKEHVCKGKWSSFFMAATQRNLLFPYLQDAFSAYCEKHDFFISYFLIDCLIAIGYEEISQIKAEIDNVPQNNKGVFRLIDALKAEATDDTIQRILEENSIHKLAYQIKDPSLVVKRLETISERKV